MHLPCPGQVARSAQAHGALKQPLPGFRNEQTSRITNVLLAFRSVVVLARLAKRSFWYQQVQRQCGASGIKQHQHAWATTVHRVQKKHFPSF